MTEGAMSGYHNLTEQKVIFSFGSPTEEIPCGDFMIYRYDENLRYKIHEYFSSDLITKKYMDHNDD